MRTVSESGAEFQPDQRADRRPVTAVATRSAGEGSIVIQSQKKIETRSQGTE